MQCDHGADPGTRDDVASLRHVHLLGLRKDQLARLVEFRREGHDLRQAPGLAHRPQPVVQRLVSLHQLRVQVGGRLEDGEVVDGVEVRLLLAEGRAAGHKRGHREGGRSTYLLPGYGFTQLQTKFEKRL